MKRSFLIVWVIIFTLVSGCSPSSTTPTAQQVEPTNPPPASETPIPTEEPTQPPLPSATFVPTATQTLVPTLSPTPEVFSAETGRQLALVNRLGGGAVQGVALSPDAAHVAVLTTLALQMYDVASASLVWEISTEKVFEELVFIEDGAALVGRTRGGMVQRWDAASGEKLGDALPIVPNTRHVALSGTGAILIAVDNFDQTSLWDTATGQQIQTNNGLAFPFGAIEAAASPDGKTFLNSGIDSKINFQIRVWDVGSGRFISGLRGLPGEVSDLRFSPDSQYAMALGTRVAGGLHGMQNLYLWRVADGALLTTVDLSLDTSAYTFLADGATALVGRANGNIMFVSFRFGERFTYGYVKDEIFAHDSAIVSLSSSADGLKFASVAADGSVKVWDVKEGAELFSTRVEGLSLQTIVTEWTYEQLTVLKKYHYPATALSPDGSLLAQVAPDLRSVNLLDASSGVVVRNLKIEQDGYYDTTVFSPDGKTVAAAFDGQRIILWDVESGLDVLRVTTQHTQMITRLRFSPDGSTIASLGNGELYVWDLATANLKHTMTAFHTFLYSGDGLMLITDAKDTGIYLVDALTGRKITFIESDRVNDLAISPDNLTLAVAGYRSPLRYQQENLVYFLDVEGAKRIRTIELQGYPAEVMDVAYTPDGSAIVSIDKYGSIYVWSATAGTLLQHFEEVAVLPADIYFSPDARTLIVTNADNTVQHYEIGRKPTE
jgi:WD40 repeat protein